MIWLMLVLGMIIVLYSIYSLKILKHDEMYKRNKLFHVTYAILGVCSLVVGTGLLSDPINRFLIWLIVALHIMALFIVPKKSKRR